MKTEYNKIKNIAVAALAEVLRGRRVRSELEAAIQAGEVSIFCVKEHPEIEPIAVRWRTVTGKRDVFMQPGSSLWRASMFHGERAGMTRAIRILSTAYIHELTQEQRQAATEIAPARVRVSWVREAAELLKREAERDEAEIREALACCADEGEVTP